MKTRLTFANYYLAQADLYRYDKPIETQLTDQSNIFFCTRAVPCRAVRVCGGNTEKLEAMLVDANGSERAIERERDREREREREMRQRPVIQ